MRNIKYVIAAIVILYFGICIGEEIAKPFNPSSTLSTGWMKSGTGTTYKMTRVDDPDKKVSCYVLDMASNPIMSCIKE